MRKKACSCITDRHKPVAVPTESSLLDKKTASSALLLSDPAIPLLSADMPIHVWNDEGTSLFIEEAWFE